jgi:hypothetical protein
MSKLYMPKRTKLFREDTEIPDYIVHDTKFIEKNGYLVCEYCEDGPSIEYENIVKGFNFCPYCGLPVRSDEEDPEE